jgi:hypothetical protein
MQNSCFTKIKTGSKLKALQKDEVFEQSHKESFTL